MYLSHPLSLSVSIPLYFLGDFTWTEHLKFMYCIYLFFFLSNSLPMGQFDSVQRHHAFISFSSWLLIRSLSCKSFIESTIYFIHFEHSIHSIFYFSFLFTCVRCAVLCVYLLSFRCESLSQNRFWNGPIKYTFPMYWADCYTFCTIRCPFKEECLQFKNKNRFLSSN